MKVQTVLRRVFVKNHIAFELPNDEGLRARIAAILSYCKETHNDYVLLTLESTKRPRTTGANSQNHHLNEQLSLFADAHESEHESEHEPEHEPAYTAEMLPYFPEPSTDGERLMNAQYDFLLFNSAKAWRELWTLTLTVAGRIIETERKKNGFYLSADERADKQMEAAEYLLRRYRTRYGYHVRRNFISAIKQSVYHALYYRSANDKAITFIALDTLEAVAYKTSREEEE